MANNSKNRGHRPKIEIDYKDLEKLCHIQCTEQEIADWFHCSVDTIERRIKEEFGISFAEYFREHRVGGKIALRRNIFKLAEKHPTMAIFLAKNWLGMKDAHEIGGIEDQPIGVEINAKGKLISLLNRIAARAGKAESDKESEPTGS